jgi:2-C-methyl-D-erythritol 2,4-cyclodiphosphate synthase
MQQMRETIAADLEIDVDSVNVKATTTEGMGFEGRGEGISSHAVALLLKA